MSNEMISVAPSACLPRIGAHLHLPQFHITGQMVQNGSGAPWPLACTDANAIFEHAGVYHIMHQTPTDPPKHELHDYRAAWGHVVSRDLVHWHRLPNAIEPPPKPAHSYDSHDGDCDGWVSLPEDSGLSTPVLTFGPDCARPLSPPANDAPRVAVARPLNASDPLLINWVKDAANPIAFAKGSPPCSFSGNVWRGAQPRDGVNTSYSMICALNSQHNAWSRYTTTDAQLHGPWHLADPSFATWFGSSGQKKAVGSISAPSFVPLQYASSGPRGANREAHGGASAPPTHMINAMGGRGFWLGRYDAARAKLDVGGRMRLVESMDSPANWFVAGATTPRDGRVLHVGFATPSTPDRLIDCYDWRPGGLLCPLTAVRTLRYDAARDALASQPVAEYARLRNGSLAALRDVELLAGGTRTLPLPVGAGAAMDVELVLVLPSAAAGRASRADTPTSSPAVTFGLDVLASTTNRSAATQLLVHIGAPRHDGTRVANISLASSRGVARGALVRASWLLDASETSLDVRVLVDRSIIEAFAAGGRAVVTARDYPAASETATRVWAGKEAGLRIERLDAWSMGCGWAE